MNAGLFHGPSQGGIARTLVYDDEITHGRWLRACAEGSMVGECRTCGGYLRPYPPSEQPSGEYDYEAECITCTKSILAPRSRVLRRSTRHGEMPGGWWEQRTTRLKTTVQASPLKGAAA